MRTGTHSAPPQDQPPHPVVYGQANRPPRGDYGQARADYTCEQHWDRYTPAQHALYARLYARQMQRAPGRACDAFLEALNRLDAAHAIPRLDEISVRLRRATGWELAPVPGLIPEHAFFSLLSQRRFPVTVWLRDEQEFDYIVEPDIFHDFFGHVPLLFNPIFADHMQAYGQGGLKAEGLDGLEYLARLYWHTIEFGLIATPQGLRVYGAGILSSAGEMQYALSDPRPRRIAFDLIRIMRSRYRIDSYQETYYVIESFEQLFELTRPDFTSLYDCLRYAPSLAADAQLPNERCYAPNQEA